MTDELLTVFDHSLEALAGGETIPALLARYPAHAAELQPMLEAAAAARQFSALSAGVQARSRARFLARAAELRAGQTRRAGRGLLGLAAFRGWAAANRVLAVSLAFLIGFVFGSYGVINASAASLPGEALYGVKRAVEQTQLLFALDPRARDQLETTFATRRVDEVERLLAGSRRAPVTFGGELEAMEGERWSVAGLTVIVPGSAEVAGVPFPGLYVTIAGNSELGGAVIATRVEVEGLLLIGTLRAMGASAWQVDDLRVLVDGATVIVGAPAVGDWVRVSARPQPDGAWLALRIAAEPGPTASPPAPSPTRTPVPTRRAPPATPPPTAVPALSVEVRFTGVVEALGSQAWRVAGQTVLLTPATEVRGEPQVGRLVEVRALQAPDGTLTALRLTLDDDGPSATHTPGPGSGPSPATATPGSSGSGGGGGSGPSPTNTPEPDDDDDDQADAFIGQEFRWEGTLEAIQGSVWVIAGQAVTVDGATEIRDDPQVGDQVEVRAVGQADGSLLALRIERRD